MSQKKIDIAALSKNPLPVISAGDSIKIILILNHGIRPILLSKLNLL
jgi:hypothetical protein